MLKLWVIGHSSLLTKNRCSWANLVWGRLIKCKRSRKKEVSDTSCCSNRNCSQTWM